MTRPAFIPYTLENENLFFAAETSNLEAAKEWVELGANVNYIEGERTVLQAAAIANNAELVEYLLQQGADPMRDPGMEK